MNTTPWLYVWGEALIDRFPEKDVVGGAPLNVARHLGALNLSPMLCTSVGNDALATIVDNELKRFGVDTRHINTVNDKPTGTVTVGMNSQGHHTFNIEPDQAYDYIQLQEPRTPTERPVFFYYGSLAQRQHHNLIKLQHAFNSQPCIRFFDLNWRQGHVDQQTVITLWSQANIVKINDDELFMLVDWWKLDEWMPTTALPEQGSTLACIESLCRHTQIDQVHVTYGAQGAAVFNRNGECITSVEAPKLERLVDTVGAGDAYSAVVMAGTAMGVSLNTTVKAAVEFASTVCTFRGAAPESLSVYETLQKQLG